MAFLYMALSWVVFYTLHSFFASYNLKRKLEAKWPNPMKKYRLIYSLFSLLLFSGIVIQTLFLPALPVFNPTQFISYLGYLITTLGVTIFLRSMKEISFSEFFGISKNLSEPKEKLVIAGIYSLIRHPLYLGILLIFLGYFMISGTIGAIIHLVCLLLYLPVGIYFEEKNLLKKYGPPYEVYRKKTPAIFPLIGKKRT